MQGHLQSRHLILSSQPVSQVQILPLVPSFIFRSGERITRSTLEFTGMKGVRAKMKVWLPTARRLSTLTISRR